MTFIKPNINNTTMKLPFFFYTKSGGIIISIQVSSGKEVWIDEPPSLHECKDWTQANIIAQAISNSTHSVVRMTEVFTSHTTPEQISAFSGYYFSPKFIL